MTVIVRPRPLTGKPGLQVSLISPAATATAHEDRGVASRADRHHSWMKTTVCVVDWVFPSSFHAKRRPIEPVFAKDTLARIGEIVQVYTNEPETARGVFLRVFQCLLPCLGQFLEIFEPAIVFRPKIDCGGRTQEVHRESRRVIGSPCEGSDKGRSENLSCQLVALEIDEIDVTGHPFGNHLTQIIDQSVVAELKCHDHGYPNHFRFDLGIPVTIDQGTESIGAGMRVTAFARGLGLRQQEIGIEAQRGIFVGSGRKLFAGHEKGLPVR